MVLRQNDGVHVPLLLSRINRPYFVQNKERRRTETYGPYVLDLSTKWKI